MCCKAPIPKPFIEIYMAKHTPPPVPALGAKYQEVIASLMRDVSDDQKKLLVNIERHPEDIANDVNTLKEVREALEEASDQIKSKTEDRTKPSVPSRKYIDTDSD